MLPWQSLSLIRKFVQLLSFLFLVYGSALVGFYAADKISGSLPALACSYDSQTADYCVLIPFQHLIDHRIGAAIVTGGDILKSQNRRNFTIVRIPLPDSFVSNSKGNRYVTVSILDIADKVNIRIGHSAMNKGQSAITPEAFISKIDGKIRRHITS